MKRKKKRIVAIMAILVACCFMLNTAVFAQGILDTEETARVDQIMITEYMVKKTMPTASEKVVIPYQDVFGAFSVKNTAISFTLCLDESNRAMAVGVVQLGGTEVAFSASGDYVTGSKTRDYTVLAMLTGQMGDETITMTVSYDRGGITSYVYLSVGKLGEHSAPIQLEFGECTENIEQVNAEVIEKNAFKSASAFAIEKAQVMETTADMRAGYQLMHQITQYVSLSSAGNVAAISMYYPDSVEKGKNFDCIVKVNMNDGNLLNYLQTNVDNSASGVIRVYSAEIRLRATSAYFRVDQVPHLEKEDVIPLKVPYLNIISNSISFYDIPITVDTLDIYREVGSSNFYEKSRWVYFYGTLGSCVNIDWGNGTPQEATKGIFLRERPEYDQSGQGSGMMLVGQADLVAGYVAEGSRPGSRVIKSFALNLLSATAPISITA